MKRFLPVLLLAACGGGSSHITYAAIGDSTTLRTDLCAPSQSWEQCEQLALDSKQPTYASYLSLVYNAGRSGNTCTVQSGEWFNIYTGQARGMLDLVPQIAAYRPTYVYVLSGANDVQEWAVPWWHPISISEAVVCVKDLWRALRAQGMEPIAVTYYLPRASNAIWIGDDVGVVKNFNTALRRAAELESVRLVDLDAAWSDPTLYTVDGVHTNVAGAQVIAGIIKGN